MEMIYPIDTMGSGGADECVYGCSYCQCLDLCYVDVPCPFCAIDIEICGVNCFCVKNF